VPRQIDVNCNDPSRIAVCPSIYILLHVAAYSSLSFYDVLYFNTNTPVGIRPLGLGKYFTGTKEQGTQGKRPVVIWLRVLKCGAAVVLARLLLDSPEGATRILLYSFNASFHASLLQRVAAR